MKFFNKISSYLNSKGRKISGIHMLLPLFLLAFFPNLAHAANLFDPSAGDISVKMIGSIFGGLLDGGGSDPMLNAIKIFNGGVLIIGGVLAAYTILAGTLGTAHDGEMLGKKFSSVWIPIRYSVGTALVLPVVGGGYCVMQAIVVWLVIQGIGLADQVWSSFMSNPATTANTVTETTSRNTIKSVAETAFRASVCYHAYDQAIQNSVKGDGVGASIGRALKWNELYQYNMRKTDQGYVFGDAKATIFDNGCGVVKYPQANTKSDVAATSSTKSTYEGRLGSFGDIFAPMDLSPIMAAQKAQTDVLVQKMDALGAQAVAKAVNMTNADAEALYKEIDNATDAYINAIKTSATSTLSGSNGFEKIKAASQNQGWLLAGAWFTRIIQMNEGVHSAINSTPTANASTPMLDAALYGDAAKFLSAMDMVLNKDVTKSIKTNTQAPNQQAPGKGTTVDANAIVKGVSEWITSSITSISLYELKNDSRHPIIIMGAIGNRLENIALFLMGAMVAGGVGIGAAAALWPGAATVIQIGVSILGWFITLPIQMLIGTALALKYFLPNLPFLIWVGCVVGWVLLVIEAVLAAPLWAIMHLHPNGDDLTGRGGNGYMLVLSLLLRPVLMIFGLIASIVISAVIGEFINKTFFEVFANDSILTGFTALFALVSGTILYFVLMLTFIRKTFAIIHMLPDQLLKWIGGGDQALGQMAGEFAQSGEKSQAIGAAIGGNVIGQQLGKGMAKVGQGMGQKAQNVNKQLGTAEGINPNSVHGLTGFMANRATRNTAQQEDGNLRNAVGNSAYSQQQAQKADASLDAEVGGGTSNIRDSFQMDAADKGNFRNAFNENIRQANNAGGGDAKNDYISQLRNSEANGYRDYGGSPAEAAKSIGQNVISESISNRSYSMAPQHSSGIESYAKAVGTIINPQTGEKSLSGRQVGSALNTASRMVSTVGAMRASEILQNAVNTGGSPQEIKSHAAESYTQAKSENSERPSGHGKSDL